MRLDLRRIILILLTGVGVIGMLAECLNAESIELLVNDTFDDGARFDGADSLDVSWFNIMPNMTSTVVNDPVINSGNALSIPSLFGQEQDSVYATFAPVTLGVGETISLSFDFQYYGDFPFPGTLFRYGLFSSGGTPVTADGFWDSAVHSDDIGYYVAHPPGGGWFAMARDEAYPLGGSGLIRIYGEDDAPILQNGQRHSAGLSITKVSETAVKVTGSFDSYSAVAFDTSSRFADTFDEIAIRGSNRTARPVTLVIDNVRVEMSAVPEPSTLMLLGMGTIGLLFWFFWRICG